jgi:hypothetical protein
MSQIILNDEQFKAVIAATGSVEVCDPKGRVLGVIGPPLSPEEEACAEEARRALASNQPRYTSEQVFTYLDKLAGK